MTEHRGQSFTGH